MKSQCNAHPKHSKNGGWLKSANTKIFYKQISIVFTYLFHYHNDLRVLCIVYSTLCLKMDAYFQDVFELNTAEHKLHTSFRCQFNLIKSDRKFGYMHLVRWKQPGQRQWTEHSMAIILDYTWGKKPKLNTIHTLNIVKCRVTEIPWNKDLLQSKSAFFPETLGWLSWLEIVISGSCYTMLEDGCKFFRYF